MAPAPASTPKRRAAAGRRRRALGLLGLLVLGACADAPRMFGLGRAASAPGPESAYARGRDDLIAGRFGLAARAFQAAVEAEPDSVEALNGLAAAYDRVGRYDLSARAYGRALALHPESPQTLNNIGYSYMLQGKFDLATVYLRDASRLDSTDPAIAANHAIAEAALRASLSRAAAGAGEPAERPAPLPRVRIERATPLVQTLIGLPTAATISAAAPPVLDTLPGPLSASIGDTRLAADLDRLPAALAAAIDDARPPVAHVGTGAGDSDDPTG